MSDKEKAVKHLLMLAMCPGNPAECTYKDACKHRTYGSECAKKLRDDYGYVLDDLTEIFDAKSTIDKSEYSLEQHVTEILREIGVPAGVVGYRYLREAIILTVHDASITGYMHKALYPNVADAFGTTSSRVARAIRYAIELAWERGNIEVLHEYFGYTVSLNKDKPTNAEFIAMIADHIRLSLDNKSTE